MLTPITSLFGDEPRHAFPLGEAAFGDIVRGGDVPDGCIVRGGRLHATKAALSRGFSITGDEERRDAFLARYAAWAISQGWPLVVLVADGDEGLVDAVKAAAHARGRRRAVVSVGFGENDDDYVPLFPNDEIGTACEAVTEIATISAWSQGAQLPPRVRLQRIAMMRFANPDMPFNELRRLLEHPDDSWMLNLIDASLARLNGMAAPARIRFDMGEVCRRGSIVLLRQPTNPLFAPLPGVLLRRSIGLSLYGPHKGTPDGLSHSYFGGAPLLTTLVRNGEATLGWWSREIAEEVTTSGFTVGHGIIAAFSGESDLSKAFGGLVGNTLDLNAKGGTAVANGVPKRFRMAA